jgi:hypothetical protein
VGFRLRSLRRRLSSIGSRMQSRPVERQRKHGTWLRASHRIFCRRHHRHALKNRTGMFSARKTISEPLSLIVASVRNRFIWLCDPQDQFRRSVSLSSPSQLAFWMIHVEYFASASSTSRETPDRSRVIGLLFPFRKVTCMRDRVSSTHSIIIYIVRPHCILGFISIF